MPIPLTARQRIALGQSHRKHMARAGHAGWQKKSRRADPLQLLADSMRGRVPSLIPIKYDRMVVSPFGFFRGAVPVMACDLSVGPNTGIHTQLCGDAHVRNLGAFAAPDGRLVFDINDFDESMRGPFEWDVKRMAASLILAGREAGARNSLCRDGVYTFLASYRASMHNFARMPVLELARFMVHRLQSFKPISGILRVAERATPLHNLDALTIPAADVPAAAARIATSELPPRTAAHSRIFKSIPPDLTRIDGAEARHVLDSVATYAETLEPARQHFLAQYTPIDIAFKIVGTGSVGLRDYCIYMQGNGARDPLFLQIKEEVASGYAPYLGDQGEPTHQGRRVVDGQRAMQFQSDPFLGWTTIQGRDYLVRQLNDHKASVALAALKAGGLLEYAIVCGETLARGHARAGDPCVIAGYIGASERFDQAIAKFAADYADQTERDWEALVRSRRNTAPTAETTASASASRPATTKSAAKNRKKSGKKLTRKRDKKSAKKLREKATAKSGDKSAARSSTKLNKKSDTKLNKKSGENSAPLVSIPTRSAEPANPSQPTTAKAGSKKKARNKKTGDASKALSKEKTRDAKKVGSKKETRDAKKAGSNKKTSRTIPKKLSS